MRSNPVLTALGFAVSDRVVIFHADDIGMCDETVTAYQELLEVGALTSAALMVPCPAAQAGAAVARDFPGADMGVHLTVTSEFDTHRWGPVSTDDPASGLLDNRGFFPQTTAAIQASGQPAWVQAELEAQVIQARAWGVDITHLDSHMGALAHPKFLPGVFDLASRKGIPAMYPRLNVQGWQAQGFGLAPALAASQYARVLERRGLPLVDHLFMLPLHEGGDHLELTRRALRELPPGITHFILHPAQDTPRLRAMTTDWPGRVANYEAFRNPRMRQVIRESGVQAIGYRPIRELLRKTLLGKTLGQA